MMHTACCTIKLMLKTCFIVRQCQEVQFYVALNVLAFWMLSVIISHEKGHFCHSIYPVFPCLCKKLAILYLFHQIRASMQHNAARQKQQGSCPRIRERNSHLIILLMIFMVIIMSIKPALQLAGYLLTCQICVW